jgi:hypothetical protein
MPQKSSVKKPFANLNFGLLYTIISAIVIVLGTLVAIQYAKGGLRFTRSGFTPETGLLNANSFPTGAEVSVDGELVAVSDNTLYLTPGQYLVEVRKEGYSPWRKQLVIQKELVTQTNAQLLRTAPTLSSLTLTGAAKVLPSPDGQKIVFYTQDAHSDSKNGLYLLELSGNFIPLQRVPKLIAEDVPSLDLMNAQLIWSPDSAELMILAADKEMVIEVGNKISLENSPDISWKRAQVLSEWEEEIYQREREFLKQFPPEMVEVATQSAKNVYLSPDKKRMLYTMTADTVLPEALIPPVPASSTQPQARALTAGSIYIYDSEEDRNFFIGTETGVPTMAKHLLTTDLLGPAMSLESSPGAFTRLQADTAAETAQRFQIHHTSFALNTLQWFPDSKHIVFATENQVHIMEYDGTNDTVVYSGPFDPSFVYPWPDGSKILILTAFSPDSPQNLYAVELK